MSILANWKARALGDSELGVMENLSRREFLDHVPQILNLFDKELRSLHKDDPIMDDLEEANQFESHGLSRWRQGFSMTELVRDWNHLRCSILKSITDAAARHPEWIGTTFASAIRLLADLIAEGINQSVAVFEEIRQAEARSHAIDLRNTIDDLKEIYEQQSNLYRDASHDLAGHLGILSSITNVFHNRSQSAELAKLYEPLSQGLTLATEILEDVKLQATLESGQAKLSVESFDLVECMQHTLAPYLMLAKEKSINLQVDGVKSLTVRTDQAKLTRVVQNLMHNALKFTRKGAIEVEWGICSDAQHFFIRIENQSDQHPAPTYPPSEIANVFFSSSTYVGPSDEAKANDHPNQSAFPQLETASPASQEKRAGSLTVVREGLGLSIANRLTTLLGGRLDIEKNSGGSGARAILTFPLAGANSARDASIEVPPDSTLRKRTREGPTSDGR